MSKTINSKFLILLALVVPTNCFGGRISFGSVNSSINVSNSATFNVESGLTNRGGRLTQTQRGGITGADIYFEKGFFEDMESENLLTGELHPSDVGDAIATYSIHLHGYASDPHRFRAETGTAVELLEVSGDHNRLEGNPAFNNPVKLLSSTATLTVAIQSVLNQDVELNGGTLALDDDLRLADGVVFVGTGTVELNNRQLSLGGSDIIWTGTCYWNSAEDIAFRSNTDLRGMWIFSGNSFLNGESTILDLTNGGTIRIMPNSALYITQVKIRGLGTSEGNGSIVFEDDTSKLYMRRSALEFTTSYTIDKGQIFVEVGSSKMILRDKFLTVKTPGKLAVDGVNLFYNTRTFPNNNNIVGEDTGAIQLINNGQILHYRSFAEYNNNTSAAGILGENKFLGDGGSGSTITIINSAPVFDGRGWYMHFSRFPLDGANTLKMLAVDPNTDAVITHMVLKDFLSEYLSIPASSSLTFGDQTTIELGANEDLSMTWTFEGECVLDGKNHMITLESGGGIDVNSSLLIKNVTIKGLSDSAIKCLDNSSTITFQNVTLLLSNNYTITTGHFEILDDVFVKRLTSASNAQFIYGTDGIASKILAGSKLHFDRDTTLRYEPLSSDKNLIQFEDESSVLSLNGATVSTNNVGLELTKGTLVIDHKCFADSQATISLGDGNINNDLQIEVMPGGNIDVRSGILEYNNIGG